MGLSLVEAKRFFEHARGVPRNCSVGWHIPGYDTTRTDDCVFADGDPAKQSYTRSDRGAALDQGYFATPIVFSLQLAVAVGCARIAIVDERDAVPDEDVVFQGHAFTNKRVTRNLTARADSGVFLDLDKRSNLGLVANLTTIEVDETKDAHVCPSFTSGAISWFAPWASLIRPEVRPERRRDFASGAAARGHHRVCEGNSAVRRLL